MASIVLYTTPWCPYCQRAKHLLKDRQQTWTEIDVSDDADRKEEMIRRSGRRTVPQIFIGSRHVGGFEELAGLARSGELDELLA